MAELSREEHRALIDALNLLCKYVDENLRPGWEITLTMNSDECYMDLTDPDGEDVEFEGGEMNYSSIVSACDSSKESEERELESEDAG